MVVLQWIGLFFRKGRGIASFLLCVVLALTLFFSNPQEKLIFYKVAIHTVLAPVQSVLNIKKSYFKVFNENEKLKIENATLQVINDQLRQYQQQNYRFRKMIQFKDVNGFKLFPGEITARDPGRFELFWMINLGSDDSVAVNMPVLTTKGIVGKTAIVYPQYSQVQLLSDPNFKVSVLNHRSRVVGILESFQLNELVARFPIHSDIQMGDTLVTSGMGGVFPKGLSVGVVKDTDLDSDDIIRGAQVIPFQNLKKVEEVFVYQHRPDWILGVHQ